MRQFIYQKTFDFSIVTPYVIWTLILLNPQPSEGILNGEWGTLFDYYGKHRDGLKVNIGDVLQKTNNDLILIFDYENYFQMQSVEPIPGQTEVQCHLYVYPQRDAKWPGLLRKVRPPDDFGVTLALAAQFTDKYLPFHPVYCNRRHYMLYILYGVTTESEQFKDCPLAAPLDDVTVEEIEYKYFKLMDSDEREHDFSEYAKSKKQRWLHRVDSAQREERNSWSRLGSSYKSMVRDMFVHWGGAIRMSSSGTILKRVTLEASDGRPPLRYRIQLVDKSTVNEAALFMHTHFINQDNLTSSLVRGTDDEMDEEYEPSVWGDSLEQGLSLAAFLEDEQGNRGPIIGCNCLELVRKPKHTKDDSKKTGKVINSEVNTHQSRPSMIGQTLNAVKSNVNVFSLYKCSSYVEGAGLAVAADYGGRGIATELLRARGEVCRMVGTPISVTVYTGVAAQRAAEKCGYKTLSELDLRTYRINGRIVYPNPKTPVIKFMGMRYY